MLANRVDNPVASTIADPARKGAGRQCIVRKSVLELRDCRAVGGRSVGRRRRQSIRHDYVLLDEDFVLAEEAEESHGS